MTPLLVTLTAPSASGKSYLFDRLMKHGFLHMVSTTTRSMREGEKEGEDYYFISKAKSLAMEKNGEFAELVEFNGTRYGITKTEVEDKFNSGKPVVAILTPEGVHIYEELVRDYDAKILRIFVDAPEELRLKRINERTFLELQEIVGEDGASEFDKKKALKVLDIHTKRVIAIVTEERSWIVDATYDLTVPGDDAKKAITLIQTAIERI
jgi:guanylate kinase